MKKLLLFAMALFVIAGFESVFADGNGAYTAASATNRKASGSAQNRKATAVTRGVYIGDELR